MVASSAVKILAAVLAVASPAVLAAPVASSTATVQSNGTDGTLSQALWAIVDSAAQIEASSCPGQAACKVMCDFFKIDAATACQDVQCDDDDDSDDTIFNNLFDNRRRAVSDDDLAELVQQLESLAANFTRTDVNPCPDKSACEAVSAYFNMDATDCHALTCENVVDDNDDDDNDRRRAAPARNETETFSQALLAVAANAAQIEASACPEKAVCESISTFFKISTATCQAVSCDDDDDEDSDDRRRAVIVLRKETVAQHIHNIEAISAAMDATPCPVKTACETLCLLFNVNMSACEAVTCDNDSDKDGLKVDRRRAAPSLRNETVVQHIENMAVDYALIESTPCPAQTACEVLCTIFKVDATGCKAVTCDDE